MAQRSDNVLLAYLRRDPVAAAVRTLGVAAAIAAAYFLAARLGLALLFARSDVAVFWPAGVAAGILIVLGHRAVPVLLIGVVVGTVAAGVRGPLTSLLNGFWNAGEALLAAWLLEHWFGRSFTFGDLRRVAGILVAAGFATAASVTGAATLTLLCRYQRAICPKAYPSLSAGTAGLRSSAMPSRRSRV
jgi:integral membrane sensor domain MASE1